MVVVDLGMIEEEGDSEGVEEEIVGDSEEEGPQQLPKEEVVVLIALLLLKIKKLFSTKL